MKFAPIIFANLMRRKVRLLLTLGSFAVALFLFAFLGMVRSAFRFGIDSAPADRLIVVDRASLFNLIPLSYKDKILRVPGVKYVTHSTWFPGVYQDGKDPFPIFAIDPQGERQVYPEFVVPDDQWQAFLGDRQAAIVGAKTAARFHWKIGDRIPIISTRYGSRDWELNLAGIYHGTHPRDDQSQFWIRSDYFQEMVQDEAKGQVGWYVVRVNRADDAPRVAQTIDDEFANSAHETKTQVESSFAAGIVKQFANIQSLILYIGAVVFFTLLLVTGNTMAIAVREQTTELAIFKAVGFSDLAVLFFVIAESLAVALLGGALGLILAAIAIPAVGKALSWVMPGLILSPAILLFGLLMAVVTGFASGLIPGIVAMRTRVVNALRKA
jgi:putative ABC transport system permease protein